MPDFWNDGLNLAYIYSTECKLEKSYKRMAEYFEWYKKNFPLNIQPTDKVVEILNTGFVYAFGRDHEFRPILICQPYILLKFIKTYSPEDISRASIFICQYVCNYMMIPGQIENWIMIINLEGTNILTSKQFWKLDDFLKNIKEKFEKEKSKKKNQENIDEYINKVKNLCLGLKEWFKNKNGRQARKEVKYKF